VKEKGLRKLFQGILEHFAAWYDHYAPPGGGVIPGAFSAGLTRKAPGMSGHMTGEKTVAKSTPPVETPEPETDMSLVTTAPDDWEFETVSEESATVVIFESPGDAFIGKYEGVENIIPDKGEPFSRYAFRGRDGARYAINKSYQLNAGMDAVAQGSWVRITLVKEVPTSRGLEPMKDFRIEVKKG
jgi:hypothetical protein